MCSYYLIEAFFLYPPAGEGLITVDPSSSFTLKAAVVGSTHIFYPSAIEGTNLADKTIRLSTIEVHPWYWQFYAYCSQVQQEKSTIFPNWPKGYLFPNPCAPVAALMLRDAFVEAFSFLDSFLTTRVYSFFFGPNPFPGPQVVTHAALSYPFVTIAPCPPELINYYNDRHSLWAMLIHGVPWQPKAVLLCVDSFGSLQEASAALLELSAGTPSYGQETLRFSKECSVPLECTPHAAFRWQDLRWGLRPQRHWGWDWTMPLYSYFWDGLCTPLIILFSFCYMLFTDFWSYLVQLPGLVPWGLSTIYVSGAHALYSFLWLLHSEGLALLASADRAWLAIQAQCYGHCALFVHQLRALKAVAFSAEELHLFCHDLIVLFLGAIYSALFKCFSLMSHCYAQFFSFGLLVRDFLWHIITLRSWGLLPFLLMLSLLGGYAFGAYCLMCFINSKLPAFKAFLKQAAYRLHFALDLAFDQALWWYVQLRQKRLSKTLYPKDDETVLYRQFVRYWAVVTVASASYTLDLWRRRLWAFFVNYVIYRILGNYFHFFFYLVQLQLLGLKLHVDMDNYTLCWRLLYALRTFCYSCLNIDTIWRFAGALQQPVADDKEDGQSTWGSWASMLGIETLYEYSPFRNVRPADEEEEEEDDKDDEDEEEEEEDEEDERDTSIDLPQYIGPWHAYILSYFRPVAFRDPLTTLPYQRTRGHFGSLFFYIIGQFFYLLMRLFFDLFLLLFPRLLWLRFFFTRVRLSFLATYCWLEQRPALSYCKSFFCGSLSLFYSVFRLPLWRRWGVTLVSSQLYLLAVGLLFFAGCLLRLCGLLLKLSFRLVVLCRVPILLLLLLFFLGPWLLCWMAYFTTALTLTALYETLETMFSFSLVDGDSLVDNYIILALFRLQCAREAVIWHDAFLAFLSFWLKTNLVSKVLALPEGVNILFWWIFYALLGKLLPWALYGALLWGPIIGPYYLYSFAEYYFSMWLQPLLGPLGQTIAHSSLVTTVSHGLATAHSLLVSVNEALHYHAYGIGRYYYHSPIRNPITDFIIEKLLYWRWLLYYGRGASAAPSLRELILDPLAELFRFLCKCFWRPSVAVVPMLSDALSRPGALYSTAAQLFFGEIVHYFFSVLLFFEEHFFRAWADFCYFFSDDIHTGYAWRYFFWAKVQFFLDDFAIRFRLKPLQLHYLNLHARRVRSSIFLEGWWDVTLDLRDTTRVTTVYSYLYEPYMVRSIRQSHFWLLDSISNRYSRGPKKVAFHAAAFHALYFWLFFGALLVFFRGFYLALFLPGTRLQCSSQAEWTSFRESPTSEVLEDLFNVAPWAEDAYREAYNPKPRLVHGVRVTPLVAGQPQRPWRFDTFIHHTLQSFSGTRSVIEALDVFAHSKGLPPGLGYGALLSKFKGSPSLEEDLLRFLFRRRIKPASAIPLDQPPLVQSSFKTYRREDAIEEEGRTLDEIARLRYQEALAVDKLQGTKTASYPAHYDARLLALALEFFKRDFYNQVAANEFDWLHCLMDADYADWMDMFTADDQALYIVAYLYSRDPRIQNAWDYSPVHGQDPALDTYNSTIAKYVKRWKDIHAIFAYLDRRVYSSALPNWVCHKDPIDLLFYKDADARGSESEDVDPGVKSIYWYNRYTTDLVFLQWEPLIYWILVIPGYAFYMRTDAAFFLDGGWWEMYWEVRQSFAFLGNILPGYHRISDAFAYAWNHIEWYFASVYSNDPFGGVGNGCVEINFTKGRRLYYDWRWDRELSVNLLAQIHNSHHSYIGDFVGPAARVRTWARAAFSNYAPLSASETLYFQYPAKAFKVVVLYLLARYCLGLLRYLLRRGLRRLNSLKGISWLQQWLRYDVGDAPVVVHELKLRPLSFEKYFYLQHYYRLKAYVRNDMIAHGFRGFRAKRRPRRGGTPSA